MNSPQSQFVRQDGASLHIYSLPLHGKDKNDVNGALVIVHDAQYIDVQTRHIWRASFLRVLIQVLIIALITLLIVCWS